MPSLFNPQQAIDPFFGGAQNQALFGNVATPPPQNNIQIPSNETVVPLAAGAPAILPGIDLTQFDPALLQFFMNTGAIPGGADVSQSFDFGLGGEASGFGANLSPEGALPTLAQNPQLATPQPAPGVTQPPATQAPAPAPAPTIPPAGTTQPPATAAPAPAPVLPPLDITGSIVPEVNPAQPLNIEELLFGSQGVLPQAAALSSVGMLAPDPSRGQATELGEQSALEAAIGLEGEFLPRLMEIFSNITSSNLAGTPEAQASLDLALRPGRERLELGTVPGIEDAAIAAGQKGSSREGIAEGLARKALIQQEGDISTRFAQDLMQRSFANQIAGLGLSPQLIANMLVPSQVFGGVGQQQEEFADVTAAGPANNLFQLANLVNATRNPEQEIDSGLSTSDRNLGIIATLASIFG